MCVCEIIPSFHALPDSELEFRLAEAGRENSGGERPNESEGLSG
jgi:hypothetical protein